MTGLKRVRPGNLIRTAALSLAFAVTLVTCGCGGEGGLERYLQKLGLTASGGYSGEASSEPGASPGQGMWSPIQDGGDGTAGEQGLAEILRPEGSQGTEDALDREKVEEELDDLIGSLRRETGLEELEKARQTLGNGGVGTDADTVYSDNAAQRKRSAIGLTAVGINTIMESQTGLYAYEHLNNDGKILYAELYQILTNHGEDIPISTLDEKTLDIVFSFVMADHPEIFYTDGYSFVRYSKNGLLVKLSFGGIYTCSLEEQQRIQTEINEYAEKCFSTLPQGAGEYDTVKHVYEYIVNNTEYDPQAKFNQDIRSVFLYGRSVCQGYAKATQYLLNSRHIEATLVTGSANGGGHAWVLALVEGSYTYIDTTWGDASYQLINGDGATYERFPMINYSYLCVTTQELLRTHTISDTLPVPVCTDMSCNYYVRENEYFISVDMDKVGELFKRRYADGSNNVTMKCSTAGVYNEMIDRLITHQEVFAFLQGANDTVAYTCFDGQYTVVIWI